MSNITTDLKYIENHPREVEFNFDETNGEDEMDQLLTELNKNFEGEFYQIYDDVYYAINSESQIEVQIVPRKDFETLLDDTNPDSDLTAADYQEAISNMDTVNWNGNEYVLVPQS